MTFTTHTPRERVTAVQQLSISVVGLVLLVSIASPSAAQQATTLAPEQSVAPGINDYLLRFTKPTIVEN